MNRSQSRRLREKIASQYAGNNVKEWTEEESFQLVRQEAVRDKQAILRFFEKKYGYILLTIWGLKEYRDCACVFVVEKNGAKLKIQTPIYKYDLPVAFIHFESAEKWAAKIGGKVEKVYDRTDRLSGFLNGENLEEVDANLHIFKEKHESMAT